MLVTHAQNLRSVWKFLANSHLELDVLEFDAGSRQPIAKLPGLRHVRVRTDEGGESPECYGVSGDETGQPKGLWRYLVPRLFGSTTGEPATHSGAFEGRLEDRSGRAQRQADGAEPEGAGRTGWSGSAARWTF